MNRSCVFQGQRRSKSTWRREWRAVLLLSVCVLPLQISAAEASGERSRPLPQQARVLTLDHLVPHVSTVPANAGEEVQLHLRERARPGVHGRARHTPDPVVLFVPGSATSSVPAYDLAFEDYSWMAHLARSGFDVFAIDLTGYGHSPRPKMDDPCNANPAQQALLVPNPLDAPCPPSYPFRLTTKDSEQDELDAAVEYIRALRGVERVSLVGWSLGGQRVGVYAAQHPDKVDRLVLNAPNYARTSPPGPPKQVPARGFPTRLRTRSDQVNWAGVSCEGQVDPAVKDPLWASVTEYDPVGASWGPPDGLMRIPLTTQWGWNQTTAQQVQAPTLIIWGELDTVISATDVEHLYQDLGTDTKAFVPVECASHFSMWETERHKLHQLSAAWLAG